MCRLKHKDNFYNMKKIKKILEEYLQEEQIRLKPRTYREYENVIELFEYCLNKYGYTYLNEEERKIFDKLYEEGNKEFCDLFGAERIGYSQIGEFLDYFLIKKEMAGKTLMKTAGRVMVKFLKWMHEKGYMNDRKYRMVNETISEVKNDLSKVAELSEILYYYILNHPVKYITRTVHGYFEVTRIELGKLWLEDYLGQGKKVGPVMVSEKISSMCKEGWVIWLQLGKTTEGWRMIRSGNVYPH